VFARAGKRCQLRDVEQRFWIALHTIREKTSIAEIKKGKLEQAEKGKCIGTSDPVTDMSTLANRRFCCGSRPEQFEIKLMF